MIRRHARLLWLLFALPGAVSLKADIACAQNDQARAAFQRGVAALDAGQFDVAADAFEQSYQLRPVPTVLINLAIARRGQGRYRDAVAAFERYLADPGNRATPATIAQARTDLEQLRAQIPTVTVRVEPASSAIAIDGQVATPGPDGSFTLDPGHHTIELTSEGFTMERRSVDLHAGSRETVSVRLNPVAGNARVQVASNVPNALIRVDGVTRGTGHVDLPIDEGDHTVDVTARGYAAIHRDVHAGRTGVTRLDLAMQSTGTPRWVVPVIVVAGGALLVGGAAWLTAYELRGTVPPTSGSWNTVHE